MQGLVIPGGWSKKREMVQILQKFIENQTIQIAQSTPAVNPGDLSNEVALI